MARIPVLNIFFLSSISSLKVSDSLIQEGLAKLFQSISNVKHVRTSDLINQLCSESQGDDIILRDACYGCFSKANSLPSGYGMLLAMSNCADTYLSITNYGHCQEYLKLRECIAEAIAIFPAFDNTEGQLAQLFVNTTACILAKTRCSFMNPITGEVQEDDLASKFQVPTINAIFVNTDYDINFVQLPFRYSSLDICSKYRNIQQAAWSTVTC